MIQVQKPYIDEWGRGHAGLEKRWSDAGKLLLQVETGRKYDAAVDVVPCRYTYEETDEDIETEEGI